MKLGILGQAGQWHCDDLRRAAAFMGMELYSIPFECLRSSVETNGLQVHANEVDLLSCDGILVRSMPNGSLNQIVFRMDALAQLELKGVRTINNARSIEFCIDKFLTLCRLQAAGLPVPPTVVVQSAAEAMAAFERFGNAVIVKPIFGGQGKGLLRLGKQDVAKHYFELLESQHQIIYLQKIIEHPGWDLRLFVIGEEMFAIKRSNPDDWRTNAARGAVVTPYQPSDFETELVWRSVRALNVTICGLDLLYDQHQQPFIIEANAVPGWRHLSEACQIDIASRILKLFW